MKSISNGMLFSEVRRLIGEGRQVTLLSKGYSMLPFIVGGRDSVLLEPCRDVAVYDILLCEISPGRYVIHRLVGIDGGTLTLMGDGNLMATEHCSRADVVAKVVGIVRPDGRNIDCCSASERRKARLWLRLLPLRRFLLALWRRTHRSLLQD